MVPPSRQPRSLLATGSLLEGRDPITPRYRVELRPLLRADTELLTHPDEVRERPGPHLVHDLAAMDLDGDLASPQLGGDLLVQEPGDDERHHFPLAARERLVEGVEVVHLRAAPKYAAVPPDRLVDRFQQGLVAERFREKLLRARFHRLHRHRDVPAPGDEDDRDFDLELGKTLL